MGNLSMEDEAVDHHEVFQNVAIVAVEEDLIVGGAKRLHANGTSKS